jgi:hypothetical protein
LLEDYEKDAVHVLDSSHTPSDPQAKTTRDFQLSRKLVSKNRTEEFDQKHVLLLFDPLAQVLTDEYALHALKYLIAEANHSIVGPKKTSVHDSSYGQKRPPRKVPSKPFSSL